MPEDFPAVHRRVQRHNDRPVVVGWPLLVGLVRTMPVVVAGVGSQHCPQVRMAVYQYPVRALGPYGPHPALGIAIRPGLRVPIHPCWSSSMPLLVEMPPLNALAPLLEHIQKQHRIFDAVSATL